MSPTLKAHWQLHFCVLLWGFTPILGAMISLPAAPLVWWRMGLVTVLLFALPGVLAGALALPRRMVLIYAGIGVIVALHWLAFYGAIKLANASIAATCLGAATAFTAVIEPMVTGRRFVARDLWLGFAVIPGVALVAGGLTAGQVAGFIVGVVAALGATLFTSFNKRYIEGADPKVVTALELGAGALFMTLVLPVLPDTWRGGEAVYPLPAGDDVWLLAVFVVFCTALPFVLSLVALKHLSAFVAQMAVNLEPIYAVALAAVLLGETKELTTQFYLGVAILFGAVFLPSLVARLRLARKPAEAATVETMP
jgi:drug/metabolite transporter (DMT)-like permease